MDSFPRFDMASLSLMTPFFQPHELTNNTTEFTIQRFISRSYPIIYQKRECGSCIILFYSSWYLQLGIRIGCSLRPIIYKRQQKIPNSAFHPRRMAKWPLNSLEGGIRQSQNVVLE